MAKRKYTRKSKKKKNFGFPLKFLLTFLVCLYLVCIFVKNNFEFEPKSNKVYKDEITKTENENFYSLAWRDYNRDPYNIDYSIQKKDFVDSKAFKNGLSIPRSNYYNYELYWAYIYDKVLKEEKSFLNGIADSLSLIQSNKSYSRHEFANVIMTFVQNIPYSYVHDDELCDPNSPKQCIRNERFGLHTPKEFLYTLLGDCDTRCVLLYGLLERFGYDPKIALSLPYRHAILLLDLPGRGQFLLHKGKKYYFWESTSKGWRLGQLPPNVSDINKWKISI